MLLIIIISTDVLRLGAASELYLYPSNWRGIFCSIHFEIKSQYLKNWTLFRCFNNWWILLFFNFIGEFFNGGSVATVDVVFEYKSDNAKNFTIFVNWFWEQTIVQRGSWKSPCTGRQPVSLPLPTVLCGNFYLKWWKKTSYSTEVTKLKGNLR